MMDEMRRNAELGGEKDGDGDGDGDGDKGGKEQPEDGKKYVQCVDFLMDFHSPTEDAYLRDTAWEPDLEYTDYHWWLARTEDGGWDVLSSGY